MGSMLQNRVNIFQAIYAAIAAESGRANVGEMACFFLFLLLALDYWMGLFRVPFAGISFETTWNVADFNFRIKFSIN